MINERRYCTRCTYDSKTPSIRFDECGVCNYCHIHDELEKKYPVGDQGYRVLTEQFDKIKAQGTKAGKKYDCVIGVSGGCDSSYLVYKAVDMGLKPLAVHFDNTWNSPIAVQNIQKVLKKLNVDLFTVVVNNKEYDDIYRSFMLAGVKDIEAPTDIGLISTMYKACRKYRVSYILEGHSFRTEGISPLGWLYMDGMYIKDVHKKFGTTKMRTYPNLSLFDFIRYSTLNKIQRLRPIYYLDYQKEKVKNFLNSEFGWEWYGGHHLENRFTAFYHSYFLPKRFGIDCRTLGYSALVRTGQMSREESIHLLSSPPEYDQEIIELVKKRLGFSNEEFEKVLALPVRTWKDYKTYKKTFEMLEPLFRILLKFNRIPESFYIKFCKAI
jgi:N-acetyl sugar amidotransferase